MLPISFIYHHIIPYFILFFFYSNLIECYTTLKSIFFKTWKKATFFCGPYFFILDFDLNAITEEILTI